MAKRSGKLSRYLLLLFLLGIGLLLCGCGSEEAQSGKDPAPGAQTENTLAQQYGLGELNAEDAKYTINLGYYNCDHMTAACIGMDAGIFDALDLKVNLTGNGNVPEAMAAGKMDVGYCGWTTTLRAVPKGVPLFIAAQNHTGGSEYLVVSHDIKKPEDLIGKRIALSSEAEKQDINWAEWSRQLGIPLDTSNYEVFHMSDQDEYFALKLGELDAYICCDPWGSMAEYENTGWTMMRQVTLRDGVQGTCCKVAMHRDFADKHPELARRILLAHALSVEYMYTHPYKAAEIFAANYNVPLEVALMTMWKKTNEEGRTISWNLKIEEMENQLAVMRELDVQADVNTVKVEDYVDTTYFDECGARDFTEFIATEIDPVFPLGMSYEDWRAKAVKIDNIVEEV